jgi:glycosyltransferase involved in cell wall biosynthesis
MPMIKDKITIVVPCKNEELYIAHLLDSINNQKDIACTRVIIADASTDNTAEIIRSHSNQLNVEIIPGGPVSYARNSGARLVTTPYILFIDSDVRFFSNTVISDTLQQIETEDLDLIGLNIKCYDNDYFAKFSFTVFNLVNRVLSKFIPFAVGAYMLTRTNKFNELGGFPEKYPTSEDFHLSKKYDAKKFKIADHYFGQDSRRFKKMGYFGMTWYLVKNFINRNNNAYWENMDGNKYWL